jgi:hypothetical protein
MRGPFVITLCLEAAIVLGIVSTSAAGPVCTIPAPNLDTQANTPNPNVAIHGDTVSFFYRSQQYALDIWSAFALHVSSDNKDADYCLRYEAANKLSNIERFYWPLAGIQKEAFPAGERVSIGTTQPPGPLPSVEETWIYAFLNTAVTSRAFQRRADMGDRSGGKRLALHGDGAKKSVLASNDARVQLAALDPIEQRFPLRAEKENFPAVGSHFVTTGAELTATSSAKWNGEIAEISVTLTRSSEKISITAPVTYALSTAKSVYDVLPLVREYRNEPLPFGSNPFGVSNRFSGREMTGSLYVIEQPITFSGSDGRVCFVAPVYSPLPIPENLLRCNLF